MGGVQSRCGGQTRESVVSLGNHEYQSCRNMQCKGGLFSVKPEREADTTISFYPVGGGEQEECSEPVSHWSVLQRDTFSLSRKDQTHVGFL